MLEGVGKGRPGKQQALRWVIVTVGSVAVD